MYVVLSGFYFLPPLTIGKIYLKYYLKYNLNTNKNIIIKTYLDFLQKPAMNEILQLYKAHS